MVEKESKVGIGKPMNVPNKRLDVLAMEMKVLNVRAKDMTELIDLTKKSKVALNRDERDVMFYILGRMIADNEERAHPCKPSVKVIGPFNADNSVELSEMIKAIEAIAKENKESKKK